MQQWSLQRREWVYCHMISLCFMLKGKVCNLTKWGKWQTIYHIRATIYRQHNTKIQEAANTQIEAFTATVQNKTVYLILPVFWNLWHASNSLDAQTKHTLALIVPAFTHFSGTNIYMVYVRLCTSMLFTARYLFAHHADTTFTSCAQK